MSGKKWILGVSAAGVLAAGLLIWWLTAVFTGAGSSEPAAGLVKPLETAQIDRGRAIYGANCAVCHGANAEGQPLWQKRNDDGTLKPPPHDESGHTWHHADGLLFRIIRDGGKIYETEGFTSGMPAFGDRLNSAEITAVIAYFKSLWGPEIRSSQAEVSQQDPFP